MAPRPPAWVAKWIGKPFVIGGRGPHGFDCYGLLREVLRVEFGKALPPLQGTYSDVRDVEALAEVLGGERGRWRPVEAAQAAAGDAVVFRVAGAPCHVGLVVADRWMLHTQAGMESALERWDAARWMARLEGFYRWPG